MQRQIDELMASEVFAAAVSGAGFSNVRITLHNPRLGLAYVIGENADGVTFDLEMAMSGFFKESDPAGAIVAAVLNDSRHAG
jgi:hypothetical protein